jgi:hypothetical protein
MHFNHSNFTLFFKRNINIYLIVLIIVSVPYIIEQNQFDIENIIMTFTNVFLSKRLVINTYPFFVQLIKPDYE